MIVIASILGGFLGGVIYFAMAPYLDRLLSKRRDVKFLRFVRVTFPDATNIETASVASSDKKALENIERRLRNDPRSVKGQIH